MSNIKYKGFDNPAEGAAANYVLQESVRDYSTFYAEHGIYYNGYPIIFRGTYAEILRPSGWSAQPVFTGGMGGGRAGCVFKGKLFITGEANDPNGVETENIYYSTDIGQYTTHSWTGANSAYKLYARYYSGIAASANTIICVSGRSQFLAGEPEIQISYDGTSWSRIQTSFTSQTGITKPLTGIAYGNGKFVVGTLDGYVTYSTDEGSTWSTPVQLNNYSLGAKLEIRFDPFNNKFYAFGRTNKVWSSPDAITWTNITISNVSGGAEVFDIFSVGQFLYAAASQSIYRSSDNGATWSESIANVTQQNIASLQMSKNFAYVAYGTTSNAGTIFKWQGVNYYGTNSPAVDTTIGKNAPLKSSEFDANLASLNDRKLENTGYTPGSMVYASSNNPDYEQYIDDNSDLLYTWLNDWKPNGTFATKFAAGQNHWLIAGQSEGRTLKYKTTTLPIGSTQQVLTSAGTLPVWAGQGGKTPTDIQIFTTPGSSTWFKPAGAKVIHVILIGGGGGGGSGMGSPTSTYAVMGGNGGAAGGYASFILAADNVSSTIGVSVGAGGAGGVADAASNPAPGSSGGDTMFGQYFAQGGVGALNTPLASGTLFGFTSPRYRNGMCPAAWLSDNTWLQWQSPAGASLNGYNGAVTIYSSSRADTISNLSGGGNSYLGPGGGGVGGSWCGGDTTSVKWTPGSNGGRGGLCVYNDGFNQYGYAGDGGAAGTTEGQNGSSSMTADHLSNICVGGNGGGGGAASASGPAGAGADGVRGGGGGGGGTSVWFGGNYFAPGRGGSGGNGQIIVISYF